MTADHPHATPWTDRHGKTRWRFRRAGKTIYLPGVPGEAVFEEAYQAAIAGLPLPTTASKILKLPTAVLPYSMRHAWHIATTKTIEWKNLGTTSKQNQEGIAERFFKAPAVEGDATPLFGEIDVRNLERRHVKAILARWSDTPHAASQILRLLRRLTGVALDQEWITSDPTYRISHRPEYKGWKAWPDDVRAAFETRWPTGSTPRLAYSLALYFGHRRSDVAVVKWTDLEEKGSNATQRKTGKSLWIPMHPALRHELEATPRRGDYVLLTQYCKPFSAKALGMRMQEWTKAAGLPAGYTLHGLRKALGKMLAESGATTRELMAILGHDDIQHAELYTREAEQRLLAEAGMRKILQPRLRVIKSGD